MKRIFAVLFAAVLLCFCFIPASAETYPVYMETDEFNVHVTVGENNVKPLMIVMFSCLACCSPWRRKESDTTE